jgi:hypothetical protein
VASESPNENKMSDGGRGRASLEWKCRSHLKKWSVRRSAVHSIDWLGLSRNINIGFAADIKWVAEGIRLHIVLNGTE